jgi:uroporphyrin-III C-methyltransferase / precorrin-2 dehydrogenase / sirohydrochlorin ferrochelatase
MGAMAGYPLLLDVFGKRVVVVGAGPVATRRATALVEAGALVSVIAPKGTEAMAMLSVDWHRRGYAAGDVTGAWLVHAATDDPDVNTAVAAEADRLGIWCVRADDAARSAAWVPAVLRDGDITVAVNAGRNPRLAAAVRDGVRGLLPQILTGARDNTGHVD